MTMTAAQIKLALKPMTEFAPAIMRCMEIVESAEAAEKALQEATKNDAARKAELTREVDTLEAVKKKINDELTVLRKDLARTTEDVATKKAALVAELTAANAQHVQAMSSLEDQAKTKRAEVTALEQLKQAAQTDMDNVKKAFEAFKAAHKL